MFVGFMYILQIPGRSRIFLQPGLLCNFLPFHLLGVSLAGGCFQVELLPVALVAC